jgi:hypothetical protein
MSANPAASVEQTRQWDDLALAIENVRCGSRAVKGSDAVRLPVRAVSMAEAEAWYAASAAVLWGLRAMQAIADPERLL